MIELVDFQKKYKNFSACENVNFLCKDCKITGLLGPNGAGKSTLMKAILGELIYDSGSIFIDNINPIIDRKNALRYLSFVPQTPPPLRLSVAQLCEYSISSTKTDLNNIINYLKEYSL